MADGDGQPVLKTPSWLIDAQRKAQERAQAPKKSPNDAYMEMVEEKKAPKSPPMKQWDEKQLCAAFGKIVQSLPGANDKLRIEIRPQLHEHIQVKGRRVPTFSVTFTATIFGDKDLKQPDPQTVSMSGTSLGAFFLPSLNAPGGNSNIVLDHLTATDYVVIRVSRDDALKLGEYLRIPSMKEREFDQKTPNHPSFDSAAAKVSILPMITGDSDLSLAKALEGKVVFKFPYPIKGDLVAQK